MLFGALLAFIVTKPDSFERTSLSFIKGEVISEVLQRYPDLAEGPLDGFLQEGLSFFYLMYLLVIKEHKKFTVKGKSIKLLKREMSFF